jgi:hypothetical protein
VAPRSEVLCNGTVRRQKTLRMARRFKPLHPPLSLSRWLMRVLRAVVQLPVLAVLHAGEHVAFGRAIPFQFVRDDHPRHVCQALEQLAEKLLRRSLVAPTLHQDVEHVASLIHRPPQIGPIPTIMSLAVK